MSHSYTNGSAHPPTTPPPPPPQYQHINTKTTQPQGYKFRPADTNPYFALRAGNEREAAMAELEEFGLDDIDEEDEDTFDDSGVEMGGRGGGNGGRTGALIVGWV